jgi:hypothetical protein
MAASSCAQRPSPLSSAQAVAVILVPLHSVHAKHEETSLTPVTCNASFAPESAPPSRRWTQPHCVVCWHGLQVVFRPLEAQEYQDYVTLYVDGQQLVIPLRATLPTSRLQVRWAAACQPPCGACRCSNPLHTMGLRAV